MQENKNIQSQIEELLQDFSSQFSNNFNKNEKIDFINIKDGNNQYYFDTEETKKIDKQQKKTKNSITIVKLQDNNYNIFLHNNGSEKSKLMGVNIGEKFKEITENIEKILDEKNKREKEEELKQQEKKEDKQKNDTNKKEGGMEEEKEKEEDKGKEENNKVEEKEEEIEKTENNNEELQKEKENEQKNNKALKRANHIEERNGNVDTKTNYQPQENLYQQKECCIVRFFKWLFCCGCCSKDSVNVK